MCRLHPELLEGSCPATMEKVDLVPVPDEEILQGSDFQTRLLTADVISIQARVRGFITRKSKTTETSLREKAHTGKHSPEEEYRLTYNIYKKDFEQFDANGNGSLDRRELKDMLQLQLGREPTEKQVNKLLKSMDFDDDGRVTLEEYIKVVFSG